MANHVTAHNSINSVRNEIVNITRSLKNSFQDLFSAMSCNAMKDASVTLTINGIKSILTDIERQLCTAQQAATALAGINRKVVQKKVSFSASYSKGSHAIDINVASARQALVNICTTAAKYKDHISVLNGCKNEMSSLSESEQILSTIPTIELYFRSLASSGTAKAVVVTRAKMACVDALTNAIKDINALVNCINEFAGPGKRISNLLNSYENCEEQVINKYRDAVAKKLLKKTSVYSDSNVPEQGMLKGEVENAESVRNSLISLTGGSCQALDDEVTRLKKLYSSHYGGAYTKEELIEMEANHKRVDNYNELVRYYTYTARDGTNGRLIPEWGCTWYAAARYRIVNGADKDLKFSTRCGNANEWWKTVDGEYFNSMSTNDPSVVKANSIAVSNEDDLDLNRIGTHATDCHVCYVEGVYDGYVYYSEGSWGTSESTWGYIRKMTIEDFCKDYEYIVSAK